MSISLALHDAATNCTRDGATAHLTLRNGIVITGKLEKSTIRETAHMKTNKGWITVLTEEIIAVEAAVESR